MLAAERHNAILASIEETGSIRTVQMAEQLEVADETVRRDLEALHGEGRLIRTHGGAIAVTHRSRELTLAERAVMNLGSKQAIALEAAKLIRPRDIVFLDASSTALELAKVLPEVELTVLTNAHDVITQLAERPFIRVIGTGGVFDPATRSYTGIQVSRAAQRLGVSKLFFSGNGLDFVRGASERSEPQAALKELVLDLADEAICLMDDSKLGQSSAYFFCPTKRISTLVTNSGVADELLAPFRASGLRVLPKK